MSNDHVNRLLVPILDIVAGTAVKRRQFGPLGCLTCDRERGKEGLPFFPPHDASSRCESGKHDHCTCDICF